MPDTLPMSGIPHPSPVPEIPTTKSSILFAVMLIGHGGIFYCFWLSETFFFQDGVASISQFKMALAASGLENSAFRFCSCSHSSKCLSKGMITTRPLENSVISVISRKIICIYIQLELWFKIKLFSCRIWHSVYHFPSCFDLCFIQHQSRLGSEILANRTPARRAISSVGFWLLADGFAAIVSGRTVKP
mgnify:CR=1 FL=1